MLREFPLAISKGRWLAETAALAALYFGTARLGQLLAIPPGNVTALWPPSGLALAAFLLLGPRAGLGVFIGAYLASIWTLFDGSNLAALFVSNTAVLMIALGSTLQALTGAFLIRTRLRTNDPFEKAYDVLGFAVIESLCCLIAPTLGVSSLGMSGYVALSACGTTWWTWWLGDFIGILVVTPLVVTWWSRPLRPVGVRRLGEALALLLLLAAVNELVFGSFGLGLPLVPATYLVAPLVIWAAIRFGPPGAALLGILGAILAVLGTVHGRGRYAGVPLENALLLIDGYIGVFALTGAVLAAAVLEKKTAQRGLQQANDELEMRVRDRTADLDRALNNMKREHIERQCAEQALWESEKSLRLRNRIAEICLTASDADMYAGILQVNLEVTQSQYGVFGYLDERGALVVPTMTRHIWEQCRIPDKDIVFPREKWGESIWPRAIHQKQTLYSNEPSTRAPQGHVAIRRNISVPIMHRGEAIGLFQVANKETDYDSNDLQNLENIGQYIAPLLAARLQRNREETARLRAEEELRTLNAELERRVRERTAQLAAANEELESF
jgi:integral membrane sensor domain MASE1